MDPKVFYGEDEKLFVTIGLHPWRQQLALAVATYFDAQIVQEELVPVEGLHEFIYYVYGDDDQVKDTQFVYHAFAKKVEHLVDTRCIGRGPIHIDSYCEGVVESIKWNIQMYGIDIPEIQKPLRKQQEEQPAVAVNKSITTSEEKEKPTNNTVDVNANSLIKDVMAYFKGLDDGKNLSLKDILELEVENEEAKRIQEAPTETK